MDKVIRDGKVAVLVSPGFGAGWSTWASSEFENWARFSPAVVAWVEGGKTGDIEELVAAELGADSYFYVGGALDLEIEWSPVGTPFIINEYDGSESLQTEGNTNWCSA
jgi:hypothetical protein